jgi:hypothetical protein
MCLSFKENNLYVSKYNNQKDKIAKAYTFTLPFFSSFLKNDFLRFDEISEMKNS